MLAAYGNAYINSSGFSKEGPVNGALYGAFAILESLGFGFLHPLEPLVPSVLDVAGARSAGSYVDKPAHRLRMWHYHTEHPLELTDLLQGFNASESIHVTSRGVGERQQPEAYFESWSSMLPQLESFLAWLVANRQNHLEWVMLLDGSWSQYGQSAERKARFATMVGMAHAWGLQVGADAPLVMVQQHAWHMADGSASVEDQKRQVAARLQWYSDVGFDYLSTESGSTEFSNPGCLQELALMNYTANEASEAFGMRSFIKVHCSTDQTCPDVPDPRTGEPINFNFLPVYAGSRLGVMPHQVQLYSFDDPTANTYGNLDFGDLFDFAVYMTNQSAPPPAPSPSPSPSNTASQGLSASIGGRDVVWHGETGYWVNYDIDASLALGALYGERRQSDLRRLNQRTAAESGGAIDGQNIFDSGWEWGYWQGAVLAARAAWDPEVGSSSQPAAFAALFQRSIARTLYGATAAGGQAGAQAATQAFSQIVQEQRSALIFGQATAPSGSRPSAAQDEAVLYRNGMAYLAGQDAFSSVQQLFEPSTTQPYRVFLSNVTASGGGPQPGYQDLDAMLRLVANATGRHLELVRGLGKYVDAASPTAVALQQELVDAYNATAIRAAQLVELYAAAATESFDNATRASRLASALQLTRQGAEVAARRAVAYRVDRRRIASWREGPTAYAYGYLWTSATGYYLWRDFAEAARTVFPPAKGQVLQRESPCFMNIISPADVGFGDTWLEDLAVVLRELADLSGEDWAQAIGDCLHAPLAEPPVPPPGVVPQEW